MLNFNGIDDTRRAVRSLLAIENVDVIPMVLDNGSSEDEATPLRAEFPNVFVERSDVNLGFSRGVNALARRALRAGATHVLLMNSDAWVPVGEPVLQRLVETLQDASLAAAGPFIRNADGTHQSAGYAFSLWWPIARALPASSAGRGVEPAFVSGSFLLVDAVRFAQLEGLDPDFFLYGEDLDFALRIKRSGLGIALVPDVAVGHTRGASSRVLSNRYVYTALRGNLVLIKKHARWYHWPAALAASLAASAGLILFALRDGNARASEAVALAWIDFLRHRWGGLTGEPLVGTERPSSADLFAA